MVLHVALSWLRVIVCDVTRVKQWGWVVNKNDTVALN